MTLNEPIAVASAPVAAQPGAVIDPGPDFSREVYCILGLPFDLVDVQQACARMHLASKERRRCFLSTPNLNFVIACLQDSQFRETVLQSNLSVIDGMPIVWIARALRLPFVERVPGSTLFDTLRSTAGVNGVDPMRVYFFGGLPGVAQLASEKIQADQSGMQAAGYETPGFCSVEEMSSLETMTRINQSGADFLVAALSARKGQAWLLRNRDALQVPLMAHLGAVINFVAGTVSRAPIWVQKMGLEWAWRIKEEPALWRRYWNDGLTLFKLLVTNVIPAALAARRSVPSVAEFDSACMEMRSAKGSCQLLLAGSIGEPNIQRWRALLAKTAECQDPLVLDCAELAFIDSAAMGSLMLLYADCMAEKRPWAILNPSKSLRRQFELMCAQYLLEPLP
ncbi:WecB/TagA/CpsF family glycosyltransferase [Herbaspirillum huttiense]|uniref:WecB/TagA/CpsF family glycosyltransferase n=1 Tax=Herbaspirillum huttiense TaxID=863372 RepID=UPI001F0DA10A|nr:WecB/TagA/CpsF family glycosyltransferase [Herbaspirillum huttiense]